MGGPVYCFSPMCRQGIETDSGGLQLLVVGSIYAHVLGFPCGSAGKESACNAGDLGLNPGLGRSPGEGKGYPLRYSGLENSMDCIIHGVAKSRTRLSDFNFTSLHLNTIPHT